ncbi:MAG: FliM/FliN family flagellar motor switch protein [Myxococcales bacterium]|nr:FliM/FliN family flagellar motor switch protein [Myxococcales bacterium]
MSRIGPQLAHSARRAVPFLTRRRFLLAPREAELLSAAELPLSLEAPAYVAPLAAEPGGSRAALGIDGRAVAFLLEGALGGTAPPAAGLGATSLTGAQRALITQLASDVVAAISPALERGAGLRLNLLPESFGLRGQSASFVALPLELVSESDGDAQSMGRVVVAVSKHALVGARAACAPDADRVAEGRVARVLDNVEVELVAELGRVPTTLSRLTALRVGEVLRTDTRTSSPVVVRVDDRVVFRAHPTTSGTQLAVRVVAPAEVPRTRGERP